MSLSAESLLDRIRLKSEIVKWRSLAIVFATLLAAFAVSKTVDSADVKADSIAFIEVKGIIVEDRERDAEIAKLQDDDNIKAVIMYINSPGGTMVGGETLYRAIRKVAKVKPVVAVMGSVAASGGYMAAIAADYIYARAGTLTGSIGVMLQSADVTELSQKIGVNFKTFKSGKMKGLPSPLEKMNAQADAVVDAGMRDSFAFFLDLVKERRKISDKSLPKITDGRIFTGRQALEHGLIDEIGGEDEALLWLQTNKNIDPELKVKDVKIKAKPMIIEQLLSKVMMESGYGSGGVLALWNQY